MGCGLPLGRAFGAGLRAGSGAADVSREPGGEVLGPASLWQHPNSLLSRPVPPKGCRLSQGLLIVLPWLLGLPLQELRRLLRRPLQSGQSFS